MKPDKRNEHLGQENLQVRTEPAADIILQASLSPIRFWPLCTPRIQPAPLRFPGETQAKFGFNTIQHVEMCVIMSAC